MEILGNDNLAHNVADIALRALQRVAGYGTDEGLDVFAFLPRMIPIPRNAVLGELVALPKPVTCVAMQAGTMLVLACWPRNAEDQSWHDNLATRSAQIIGYIRSRTPQLTDPVLWMRDDSLTITLQELGVFLRDYDIQPASLRVDLRDDQAHQRGAVGSLKIDRLTARRSIGTLSNFTANE